MEMDDGTQTARISCTITADDLAASARHGMGTHPELRVLWDRFRRNLLWLTGVAVLFTAVFVWGLVEARGSNVLSDGLIYLCGLVVMCLWFLVISGAKQKGRLTIEKRIQDAIKLPRHVYHSGPQVIELYPTHLRAEFRHHDIDQRWGGIIRIDDTADHVFIVRVDTATFIVPKRAFNSVEEAADFVAIARRYHLDAVGPTVRAYFAEREVRCSTCGYSLRGNTGLSCPECGRAIDLAPICGAWDEGDGRGAV